MATPLELLKRGEPFTYDTWQLAVGQIPGCIGETSAVALLAGGLFLIARRYVDWRLPLAYLASLAALTFALPAKAGDAMTPFFSGPVLAHLFGGGSSSAPSSWRPTW